MKCRQFDVKVFEIKIETDQGFIDFMENNYVLLKNHLLSLKGEISDDLLAYLNEKGLFFVNNMELPKRRGVKEACIINHIEAQNRAIAEHINSLMEKEIITGEDLQDTPAEERSSEVKDETLDEIVEERVSSLESQEREAVTLENISSQAKDEALEELEQVEEIKEKQSLETKSNIDKEIKSSNDSLKKESKTIEIDIEEIKKKIKITAKDIKEKSEAIEAYGYGDAPLKVVNRPLRSGQVVEHEGAVLIMDRVNSGASIAALGSVIALGVVEGDISSTGECLIIPRATKGNIFFHGIRIDLERLIYPLNKLIFVGDRISVQAISKKELI